MSIPTKPFAFTLVLLGLFAKPILSQTECASSTFQDVELFSGKILKITAQSHSNLSYDVPAEQNHYPKTITSLDFCEVNITYTHPGYNDEITTKILLPSAENWTGRFMGQGGGGFSTGATSETALPWAASEGFAVVTTDGGHVGDDADWALVSPGNVDIINLQNFASVALDDATTLGKAVAMVYYGKAPSYSYWNGCSTGGRQGHMMAQRYPGQYDGILATAPAIYWNQLMMELFWPHAVMNELGEYPTPCEFEAINAAAIEACDAQDGLKDGIILFPQDCEFDPTTLVGQQHTCPSTNGSTTITQAAATVAKATLKGPVNTEGGFLWYGLNPGTSFKIQVATECNDGTCIGVPLYGDDWIRDFLLMDPSFDVFTVNTTAFDALFHQAINRYDSIIGTSDVDLRQFRNAGGKLITWHGLADTHIPPGGTEDYVKRVYKQDPKASEYYRYFEAPGVGHCTKGSGWYPGDGLKALIDWVENGIAPETLEAETVGDTEGRKASLCMWPKRLVHVGGDASNASSFGCQ